MKKLLLVSKEWSPKDKTGLGFCSTLHEQIFKNIGFHVFTVSLNNEDKNYNLKIKNFVNFLFNFLFFFKKSNLIIKECKPDFIVVESLQTIISEIFIYLAKKNNIKVVIISHGISIFPYNKKIKYILRTIIWILYMPFLFFFLKSCDVFFSLDPNSNNSRHLDTKLFKIINNKLILKYNNSSRFEKLKKDYIKISHLQRKTILCIGYINHIKNQEDLIKLAESICDLDIDIKILYNSFDKNYFNKLKNYILFKSLRNVYLVNEKDTDIFTEIVNCWFLINVSITEVLPLSLIEGNSLSRFFLSYNVGSLEKFKGSIIHYNLEQVIFNIKSLYNNNFFSKKLEREALNDYNDNYCERNLQKSLSQIKNMII